MTNSETVRHPAWLGEAWRLFGVRELKGRAHNRTILELYRDVGHSQISADEVRWCAAFVGACLERVGLKSSKTLMVRSYTKWGREATASDVGAVAVLSRGHDRSLGHVGFIVGETGSKIYVLGGNQANSVSVAAFPKSRLITARWPSEQAKAPDPVAAKGGRFDDALAHVLEMEGGYSNDPHDPGGPTNFGIRLKVFARWAGENLTPQNRADLVRRLKVISPETVRNIYFARYWQLARCSDLPNGLALMHFDTAVNQGVSRAVRWLQTAVGTDVDGEIGPLTLKAVKRTPVDEALLTYAGLRSSHYRSLYHFWRFGRGWLNRVAKTLERARALGTPTPKLLARPRPIVPKRRRIPPAMAVMMSSTLNNKSMRRLPWQAVHLRSPRPSGGAIL